MRMLAGTINNNRAIIDMNTRRYAILPDFHQYLETDLKGIVGAYDCKGRVIPLIWAQIEENDIITVEVEDIK